MFDVCSVFKGEFVGERDGGHGCWGGVLIFYMIMKLAYHPKKTSRGLVTQVSGGTMTILSRTFILISMTSLLSACGSMNNIYWKNGLPGGGEVMTVDAKQRHLIMLPDGSDPAKWRICAEAAPDVFSAVNSSFGGEFGFGGAEQKAKAASAIAEAAATVERTQTINLLRESMYRTCERFLSGAISEETLVVQAARDQQTMLAVLAIEQLTGTTKGTSTIITGPSTSASVANGEKAAELIQQFNNEYTAAKSEQSSAIAALTAADKNGKCLANEAKPSDVDDTQWADCQAAKTAKASKDAKVTDAKSRLDKALGLGAAFSNQVAATTTGGQNTPGANPAQPDSETIKAIAQAVETIATRPAINESLMFCISALSRSADRTTLSAPTLDLCRDVVLLSAKQDNQIKAEMFGSSLIQQDSIKQYRSYNQFLGGLISHLSSIGDDKIVPFIAAFEKAAGFQLLSLPNSKCVDRSTCLEMITQAGGVYSGRFGSVDFDAALQAAKLRTGEK